MATYKSDMARSRTCVYRAYDADGGLLYVGMSRNPAARFSKHYKTDWWPQVSDLTYEWFSDRDSARIAESAAIADECPANNVARHLTWEAQSG